MGAKRTRTVGNALIGKIRAASADGTFLFVFAPPEFTHQVPLIFDSLLPFDFMATLTMVSRSEDLCPRDSLRQNILWPRTTNPQASVAQ